MKNLNRSDLIRAIIQAYNESATEFSEEYLRGFSIKMKKAEFIEAYAELQLLLNGDAVVRLDRVTPVLNGKPCFSISQDAGLIGMTISGALIPEGWGDELVEGDAREILLAINKERFSGGPIFARICGETLLDLAFGEFRVTEDSFKEEVN